MAFNLKNRHFLTLRDVAYVFIGDAANNMGDSLLIGGAKMGMDVRLCAPKAWWPIKAVLVATLGG